MIRIDTTFHWAALDKNTPIVNKNLIPSQQELYPILDADDSWLVGSALLYKDFLCLHMEYDGMRFGPDLYQCRLPDPYLMEVMFQISPLTKSLANKYIDYEASTLDEYKIRFMARILGQC